MSITINGKEGSGKSTIARMVADALGYTYYDIGSIRRQAAQEKGMTLEEYNRYGETHEETDIEVDRYQERLGKEQDDIVVCGRTSFYFIPKSIKIYLDVDLDAAAERIFQDKKLHTRNERDDVDSLEDITAGLRERVRSDNARYKKYYNLNIHNRDLYDLVVDTTGISIEDVFRTVMSFLNKKGLRPKNLTGD